MARFNTIPKTDWHTIAPEYLSDRAKKAIEASKAANKALYESDLAKAAEAAKAYAVKVLSDDLAEAGNLDAGTLATVGFPRGGVSFAGVKKADGSIDYRAYAKSADKAKATPKAAKNAVNPFAGAKLYTKTNGKLVEKASETLPELPAELRRGKPNGNARQNA